MQFDVVGSRLYSTSIDPNDSLYGFIIWVHPGTLGLAHNEASTVSERNLEWNNIEKHIEICENMCRETVDGHKFNSAPLGIPSNTANI